MSSAVGFRRPRSFWLGTALIAIGVGLHLPMFVHGVHHGKMLAGMGWDLWMILGMVLIPIGFVAVLFGLGVNRKRPPASRAVELDFEALDSSRLSRAHVGLMLAMTIAIAIDTMKPFTFTFILPGVAEEYNLSSPSHPAPGELPVAIWPFVAILGTVVGSLVLGWLADRVGRRATTMFVATMFMATATCGVMTSLMWNLIDCFLMGFAAGGLLPIAYSLLTETVPVKRRGQLIVLVAGIGTAVGFLLASWGANLLIDPLGWRVMWLLNLPTGLALLLLNRYIPESPRFLLAVGRGRDARAVMRRFGIVPTERSAEKEAPAQSPQPPRESAPTAGHLFRPPYRGITFALVVFALSWGLANFGFLVWLPVYLAKTAISAGAVTDILAKAALFSIPGSLLFSWLYGHWGSARTLIAAGSLSAATLGVFVAFGEDVAQHTSLLTAMVVALLMALWASIAVLAPYSAEIYPTAIRAVGSGVVAGASKLGGVFALSLAVATIAPPSIGGAALLAAVPAAVGTLMLVLFGIETRNRGLEEITGTQLGTFRPQAEAAG